MQSRLIHSLDYKIDLLLEVFAVEVDAIEVARREKKEAEIRESLDFQDEMRGLDALSLNPLVRAGYRSRSAVEKASDKELLAINNVGKTVVARIRAYLGSTPQSDSIGRLP